MDTGTDPEQWTYMFTDIVDSTALWEAVPDLMAAQLEVHDRVLRGTIRDQGGLVFSSMGDGLGAAFANPDSAVATMLSVQREFAATDWPDGCVIQVRMGANTGRSQHRDDDFFGPAVNLGARVMAAAHGGQILLAASTAERLPESADHQLESLGAHRLRGVAQPVELLMLRHPDLADRFPPLRVLEPGRFTIPEPTNGIIGRETDLAAIQDRVRTHRCTTIAATGGAGKTRLAIEAAVRACDVFPAGVHVVELAGSDNVDDLTTRVAELVLGAEATAGPAEHLRRLGAEATEPVLVVIDNAEHVIDECADAIASLLRVSKVLTFLVTSREPLRIAGESTYFLEPLALQTTHTESGVLSDAARLFVERAVAHDSNFDIESDIVEEIVRRLDGLPLAVELAASGVAMLGARDLLRHLDKVLAHSPARRGTAARHRTIDAAIDWSVERCSDDERLLLARLAVFPDSFDLDATTAICADDGLDAMEVFGALASLVDKSLVSVVESAGDRRYRLLQLIRRYASGLQPGRDDLAERHAKHYVGMARQQAQALHREASPEIGEALGDEHDNFVAILERGTVDESHRPQARRLCISLQSYWEDTGRLRIGADWMARLSEPHDIGDRAWASVVLVGSTYDAMCGLTPQGRQPVDTIRQFADLGVPGAHAMQMPLAFIDLSRGAIPEAIERFRSAAAGFDDDVPNRWQALMTAGALADYDGDPRAAAGFYADADQLDRSRLLGWNQLYRDVFVIGSHLGERGADAEPALVDRLIESWTKLFETGLATRSTIAGHRTMWALEQAQRFDLIEEHLAEVMALPRRTGYLWFSLALADLAAHVAIRRGATELGLRLEGAIDARLTAAEFGFPRTFERRRQFEGRTSVSDEDARRWRADGADLTIAGIDELAAKAVTTDR